MSTCLGPPRMRNKLQGHMLSKMKVPGRFSSNDKSFEIHNVMMSWTAKIESILCLKWKFLNDKGPGSSE